jgi:hypothetical protein
MRHTDKPHGAFSSDAFRPRVEDVRTFRFLSRLLSQPKTSNATINEDSQPTQRDSTIPANVYLLVSPEGAKMPDKEWVKTLEDGRKVKFTYQELPEDGAFITAQLGGNELVYSVILTKAVNPLSREDVESHFRAELAKK